jgi:hypothetical protein
VTNTKGQKEKAALPDIVPQAQALSGLTVRCTMPVKEKLLFIPQHIPTITRKNLFAD